MVVIMLMTTNNSHHNANTTTFCPAQDLDLQELLAREQAQGNGQQGQGRGIDACVAQAHREGVLQSLYGLLITNIVTVCMRATMKGLIYAYCSMLYT